MKVLIISKHFPPSNSAQALQIGKVVEAICGMGCVVKVIAGHSGQGNTSCFEHCEVHYVPYGDSRSNSKLLNRITKRVHYEIESINPYGKWITQACEKALDICSSFTPDIILTSSTPFETHMIGMRLCRKYKVKWVASFSDPWPVKMSPAPYSNYGLPILTYVQSYWLEKILSKCDAIHMTTQYANEIVSKKINLDLKRKMWTIQHIGTEPSPNNQVIEQGWLVHIGHLTRERVSTELIHAINEISRDPASGLKGVILVGDVCPELLALRNKLGMEDKIKIVGRVSHEEALNYALRAHCLLVCEANMEISPFLPSKFADYAMVGRPILALTPKTSAMRDYIEEFGCGFAVEFNQKEIEKILRDIFVNRMKADNLPNCKDLKNNFSLNIVGEKYKKMFESLMISM